MDTSNEEELSEAAANFVAGPSEEHSSELAEIYARERAITAEKLGAKANSRRWARAADAIREEQER